MFPGARLKYGDPLYLDDVAVDFPELAICLSHGGRPFWYDRAFALARLHRNVYIDAAGLPPRKLLDYFPDNYLTIIDESHVTVRQIGGQYKGAHSRKQMLVEHGFRLPSAMDNRPLRFDEWLEKANQVVFLSATPSEFELARSTQVVEQIARPTGLVDPEVVVRPTKGQIDDLLE